MKFFGGEYHAQLSKEFLQSWRAIRQASKFDTVSVDIQHKGLFPGYHEFSKSTQFVRFFPKELNHLVRVFNGAGINDHFGPKVYRMDGL